MFYFSENHFVLFHPSTIACACVGIATQRLKLLHDRFSCDSLLQHLAELLVIDLVRVIFNCLCWLLLQTGQCPGLIFVTWSASPASLGIFWSVGSIKWIIRYPVRDKLGVALSVLYWLSFDGQQNVSLLTFILVGLVPSHNTSYTVAGIASLCLYFDTHNANKKTLSESCIWLNLPLKQDSIHHCYHALGNMVVLSLPPSSLARAAPGLASPSQPASQLHPHWHSGCSANSCGLDRLLVWRHFMAMGKTRVKLEND